MEVFFIFLSYVAVFVAGAFLGNKASGTILREYELLVKQLEEFLNYVKGLEGRTVLSAKELAQAVEGIFGKKK